MADNSRSNKGCINTSAVKSSTGCVKTILRISCIILSFFTIVCTCVVLGELEFPSLEDHFPGLTDIPAWKTFSDRLEGTRQSTQATGICLAIISFIAVILEITLLVIGFFSCAVSSSTLLLIVDIVSGVVCALLLFAVSVPMEFYNGEWSEINGIIEFVFEISDNFNNNFIDPSEFKMLFNLDQLIPASGAAAVFGFLSTFAFVALVVASIMMILTSRKQSASSTTGKV